MYGLILSYVFCGLQKVVSNKLHSKPTSYVFKTKIEGVGRLYEQYFAMPTLIQYSICKKKITINSEKLSWQ